MIFEKNAIKIILFFLILSVYINNYAQKNQPDSIKMDYEKIYSYCLDGNVSPALTILRSYDSEKLSEKDLKFKTDFENRFRYEEDKSGFTENKISPITELFKIYINYWRLSLIDNSKNYDTLLIQNAAKFLNTNFQSENITTFNEDSIDIYTKKYINSLGLHTTGFGKTGKYYDLLVWKTEEDTTYTFKTNDEKINVNVVFMDNFITLGWEEYATLGRHYPGGWATKEKLFCVKSAYDLKSENFMISYLAHESRHFADYKLFPKLMSADLEYRAKLTELSLAQKTLYSTIEFFIKNSNYESDNGHSVANYCIIRDLSRALFKTEFEKDINRWKEISDKEINKTASELLKENTRALNKIGAEVEKYIKK